MDWPHPIHEYNVPLQTTSQICIFLIFLYTYMYIVICPSCAHVFVPFNAKNNEQTLYRGLFRLFWTPTNTYWINESTFPSTTVMFLSPASLIWHTSLKSEAKATYTRQHESETDPKTIFFLVGHNKCMHIYR